MNDKPASDEIATKQATHHEAVGVTRSFRLLVVGLGELVIDGARASRALIGQSTACDLRVPDPLMSRRHATVEVTPKGLRIFDSDSTNGTFVNGIRITEAHLQGGEVVGMGGTTLQVQSGPARQVELTPAMRFGRLIGTSPQMRRLFPLCEALANNNEPIVIEGETGTGKELLAEALHEASPRAKGPFVVFDCNGVPDDQVAAALFGDDRSAVPSRGAFEEASGGTLFIDEIGDLPLSHQAHVLHVLATSEVNPVGSQRRVRVDVRIVTSTQRDLDRLVMSGRFREDLFRSLGRGRLELPPLRDRAGDAEALARHFWRVLGGAERPMPAGMLERFSDHRWPGNVRELQNAIARVLALGEADVEEPRAAGAGPPATAATPAVDFMEQAVESGLPLTLARNKVIAEFDRRYVTKLLLRHGGNVSRAAAASGLARRYFDVLRSRHLKRGA